MREVEGEQVAELAPIFPGWIEVALFRKDVTPQRLQLLDKFQEILRMEELLNLPPVTHCTGPGPSGKSWSSSLPP